MSQKKPMSDSLKEKLKRMKQYSLPRKTTSDLQGTRSQPGSDLNDVAQSPPSSTSTTTTTTTTTSTSTAAKAEETTASSSLAPSTFVSPRHQNLAFKMTPKSSSYKRVRRLHATNRSTTSRDSAICTSDATTPVSSDSSSFDQQPATSTTEPPRTPNTGGIRPPGGLQTPLRETPLSWSGPTTPATTLDRSRKKTTPMGAGAYSHYRARTSFTPPVKKNAGDGGSDDESCKKQRRGLSCSGGGGEEEEASEEVKAAMAERDRLVREVAEREETLRQLELVEFYQKKHDLNDLQNLIDKWRSASQQALVRLQDKLPDPKPTLGEVIKSMGAEPKLVQYNEEFDDFSPKNEDS